MSDLLQEISNEILGLSNRISDAKTQRQHDWDRIDRLEQARLQIDSSQTMVHNAIEAVDKIINESQGSTAKWVGSRKQAAWVDLQRIRDKLRAKEVAHGDLGKDIEGEKAKIFFNIDDLENLINGFNSDIINLQNQETSEIMRLQNGS